MNLRSRITIGYVLLVLSSFSLIIYLILKDVRPRYLEAVEEATVDTSELMAAMISQQLDGEKIQIQNVENAMSIISKRSLLAKIYGVEKQKVNLSIYITDKFGKLIYDSTGKEKPGTDFSKWNDIFLTLKGKYGVRSTRTVENDPMSSTIYIAAPIEKNGRLVGVVSIGKPKNSVKFFVEIARKKFLIIIAMIGISAIFIAIFLSNWITRPIRKLTEYVHLVEQGKPVLLPNLGSSEIGALGRALEEMRSKLEGKKYIEDYVRSLTHEMKSPLTAIKGANEILREEALPEKREKFLNNIDTETSRLLNLVEQMLELSRLENVKFVNHDTIFLKTLIAEILSSFAPQLNKKSLKVEMNIHSNLTLKGDLFLIRQSICNVFANAIDFSLKNSLISITANQTSSAVSIIFRDYGSGIPDFAIDKVFDKFFSLARPETGKKSTGLGLSFVKQVMSLHEGEILLKNTNPGLQVDLIFKRG